MAKKMRRMEVYCSKVKDLLVSQASGGDPIKMSLGARSQTLKSIKPLGRLPNFAHEVNLPYGRGAHIWGCNANEKTMDTTACNEKVETTKLKVGQYCAPSKALKVIVPLKKPEVGASEVQVLMPLTLEAELQELSADQLDLPLASFSEIEKQESFILEADFQDELEQLFGDEPSAREDSVKPDLSVIDEDGEADPLNEAVLYS